MKVLIVVCVLAVILPQFYVEAAVDIEPPNPKRKENGCYTDKIGHFSGKTIVKGECLGATCNKDGSIQFDGCGVIGVSDEYTISEEDLTKPHPDCCPRPVPKH